MAAHGVEQSPSVCCIALTAFGLGPRVAILLWWIFGDRVDAAFSTWVWPLLGLLLLPWTTLFYLFMWSSVGGVHGAEWIVVALGFVLDLIAYSSRKAKSVYDTRYA